MNQYLLSFFVQPPAGAVRAATTTIWATCATEAILTCEALPWPGPIVGAITWSLIGPPMRLPRRSLGEGGRPLARHDLSPISARAA